MMVARGSIPAALACLLALASCGSSGEAGKVQAPAPSRIDVTVRNCGWASDYGLVCDVAVHNDTDNSLRALSLKDSNDKLDPNSITKNEYILVVEDPAYNTGSIAPRSQTESQRKLEFVDRDFFARPPIRVSACKLDLVSDADCAKLVHLTIEASARTSATATDSAKDRAITNQEGFDGDPAKLAN